MCLISRIKLSLTHSFYVGGLTFFSTLSTKFIDERILSAEIVYCLMAGFIAGGIAFFSSLGIQQHERRYAKDTDRAYKDIKTKGYDNSFISSIFNRLSPRQHIQFWHNMFIVTHLTQNIDNNRGIYD